LLKKSDHAPAVPVFAPLVCHNVVTKAPLPQPRKKFLNSIGAAFREHLDGPVRRRHHRGSTSGGEAQSIQNRKDDFKVARFFAIDPVAIRAGRRRNCRNNGISIGAGLRYIARTGMTVRILTSSTGMTHQDSGDMVSR
jgi:hypothetical protein